MRVPVYDWAVSGLRIVFMGTPGFVVPVLESVVRFANGLGGSVVAAYTAPDEPAGRGRRVRRSAVSEYAEAGGIPVMTPRRVTTSEETERFVALGADLVVLAAYGLLLPRPFLYEPTNGAVNVHPSLLPRHRGASPVAAAILAGDDVTGTSLIRMDEGLDTGPVLAQSAVALAGSERTPELTERLFGLGAAMLEECLPGYVAGELAPVPQASEGVTVVKRFAKEDGALDWTRPAVELERRVRAFDPWPGTATTWGGKRLEVLDAGVADERPADVEPGTVVVLGRGVGVACGEGLLELGRVRLEGRGDVSGADFARGRGDFVGARLPS